MDKMIQKIKEGSWLIVAGGWIIAFIMTVIYQQTNLKLSQCEDRVSGPEIEVLEGEYMRADKALVIYKQRTDSLLRVIEKSDSIIAMLELKSINGKTKLYQDITTWRNLPADQRVLFFTKELAKIDTIR